jgi:hypothetical protein
MDFSLAFLFFSSLTKKAVSAFHSLAMYVLSSDGPRDDGIMLDPLLKGRSGSLFSTDLSAYSSRMVE